MMPYPGERPFFGVQAEDAYHASKNQAALEAKRRAEKIALNRGVETKAEREARLKLEAGE
jgi:hypothetical protein